MEPATLGELSMAAASNNNNDRKQRIPPYAKIPGSLGSSSGYAGDLESMNNGSRLPASIELTSRQKKRYAIIDIKPLYPEGKRPKPTKEELTYMAMNTKQDMEKGGVTNAKRRPRVFPPQSKVDMSLVRIISSSEYDKEQKSNASSSSTTSDIYQAVAVLDQFEQVAMGVAHCYRPAVQSNVLGLKDFHEGVQKAQQHSNELQQQQDAGFQSDSSSSAATSSFTESDGGEDETTRNALASQAVSLFSASSSSLQADEQDAFAQEDPNNSIDYSCQLMSLEQALSFSERPKIVALSTAPHLIIYANAAFQRSIGPATNVVGKATSHVFHDAKTLSSTMSMVVDAGQPTMVAGQRFHTSSNSKAQLQSKEMTLSVFPVGSASDQVTTYLGIEVAAVETTDLASSASSSMPMMG